MTNPTQQIVNKAWNFAHVLRDDGLSYMGYTEQITFLLFLKMADEQSKPPYNRKSIVPKKFNWESLTKRDGDELLNHYRHMLEELAKKPGMGAVRLMRGEHSDFSGLRGASGQRQSVLTEAISHTLCSKSCSTEYNEVS